MNTLCGVAKTSEKAIGAEFTIENKSVFSFLRRLTT